MTTSKLAGWLLVGATCTLMLAPPDARSNEIPAPLPIPDRLCAKLQVLFEKHYPEVTFKNRKVNGIRFEYEVRTFEFPYTGPSGGKHEATTKRGPKEGEILCHVYSRKGSYHGQLSLWPRGNGQFSPYVIDRKVYKDLLMVPYSPKQDAHLWVALSYPPDASEAFLKQFRAIMTDFENDVD